MIPKITIYAVLTIIYWFTCLTGYALGLDQKEKDLNDNHGHDPYKHLHKGWHNTPLGFWTAAVVIFVVLSGWYWVMA